MDFDVLVIGGGAAGMSCALVLGSGLSKPFAKGRRVGIILHQKTSHLQNALFNNVLGVSPGTTGKELLKSGPRHLAEHYPEVIQIEKEKVSGITEIKGGYRVTTNKGKYDSQKVVLAVGYSELFHIDGVEEYVIPHKKSKPSKKRIQLKNEDHLVAPGLYVAGSLAGHRSQFAIACGSGTSVAADILTEWNEGEHVHVHDKV